MTVRKEQEVYLKFYNYAMNCIAKKDYETARKALICAISTLMRISSQVSEDNKKEFTKRIFTLIEKCSTIKESDFDGLYGKLDNVLLGLDVVDANNEKLKQELDDLSGHALDEVAGLEEVKMEIQRRIINPYNHPDVYRKFRKKSGGGILLYGLPGTGKTMICKALAKDIKAEFIAVKCSDLLSKYFGESEGNLKKLFDQARSFERAIIFFDEFEAIGSSRTGGEDRAMDRFVPELLAQIQGFDEHDTNLIVIAATNRPWDIDSAFLRPGRFGRKIYVSLPDATARQKIIVDSFRGVPKEENFNIDKIVELSNNYSGADVNEVCECAKLFAIEREIETNEPSYVTMNDILEALQIVSSSIIKKDMELMEKYREQNCNVISKNVA